MGKSLVIFVVLILAVGFSPQFFSRAVFLAEANETAAVPQPPDASFATDPSEPSVVVGTSFFAEYIPNPTEYPARISIPSIELDSPVAYMGLNSVGEIDVPDGTSNSVGWYKHGTVPGNLGNAIMDAHVYAAFNNLRYAKIGDEIFVETAGGDRLRFIVSDSRVYSLAEVPMEQIVHSNDSRQMVLITCARRFSPVLGTYTHRLVVTAQLAE
jgi:LPXTG-site transpeptidase (sortase) family protein